MNNDHLWSVHLRRNIFGAHITNGTLQAQARALRFLPTFSAIQSSLLTDKFPLSYRVLVAAGAMGETR